MTRIILSLLLLFFCVGAFAQKRTITGTVTDAAGKGVPSASVNIKGTGTGTTTNADGHFSISAPSAKVTLEINSVGFTSRSIEVSEGQNDIGIALAGSQKELETAVVTALGIARRSRTLTYSTQTVASGDISTVKNTNVLNSLNGKVSGVQINRTSGGAGGSVRVVLRGDKSTTNGQPLYVIDGLPIVNPTGGPDAGLYNSAPDYGDFLGTINPDDIESISVLKGASASALYGSQGSNGVILVTTKKGKSGATRIDFSSGVTFDNAFDLPKLQYTYGQTGAPTATAPGTEDSWGAKGATQPGSSYVKDFFQTGMTLINSISLSSGNERSTNYLSYSNTDNSGILPNSTLKQNTLGFRQSSKMLNDKLIFDGSFLGTIQTSFNRLMPGIYSNPLTGLYLFPRGLDFNQYKKYEYFSPSRYINAQNWWNINTDKGWIGQDYQQNPYWVMNRNTTDSRNQNVYAAVSLKYLLNSWLTLQARGNANNFINEYQRKLYATTQQTLAKADGLYTSQRVSNTTLYGDLLLTGDKKLDNDWNFGFMLGTSIQDRQGKYLSVAGSPIVPNVFIESAIDRSTLGISNNSDAATNRQVQSVFGSVQLGFRDKIFFDFADRNDWSSTLAFTSAEKKGYNYYSAGASAVLSELLQLPAAVDFSKIRVSYAQVGNDIAAYSSYPLYTFTTGTAAAPSNLPVTTVPGLGLKPETSKSFEIGTQWNFLKNRLSFDLTWYNSNTINQYFKGVNLAGVTTSTTVAVNAGKIRNTGIEASLSYKIKDSKEFRWTSTLNFSHNKNTIVTLFDPNVVKGVSSSSIYGLDQSGGYSYLKQGGSFGDMYGRTYKIDSASGAVTVDPTTHVPIMVDKGFLGNPMPKYIVGWNNSFTVRNFNVNILIDGKFGGQVLSITQGYLDQMGVSARSGAARDNGGTVTIPNAITTGGTKGSVTAAAKDYYQSNGGKTPGGPDYVFSATAVRLRELAISYNIPFQAKGIRNLQIGVIGNNLFFFKKDAPFDPEQVAGVNPGGVGVDAFGLPAYRSIGFSVKCSF